MNPCSSCPKSFDSKRKLYRHVNRTHTQEPLMCSLCSKSFARKDILVRHIRQHHPETDGASSNSAATFRCNTCSKVFARKDNLLAHIRAKHMDLKSECRRCAKGFRFSTDRIKHEKYYCPKLKDGNLELSSYGDSMEIDPDEPPYINITSPSDLPLSNNIFPPPEHTQPESVHADTTKSTDLVDSMDTDETSSVNIGPSPEHTAADNHQGVTNRPGTSNSTDSVVDIMDTDDFIPTAHSQQSPDSPQREDSSDDSDAEMIEEGSFRKIESGFQNRLQTFELGRKFSRFFTLWEFFVFICEPVVSVIAKQLMIHKSIKVNIFLECEFINVKGTKCMRNFKTKNEPLYVTSNLSRFVQHTFEKILHEKECCEMNGSGWSFLRIRKFEIRINKYNPLRGAKHMPLPSSIFGTRSVINCLNDDEFCFQYAMLSKFVSKPERPSSYTEQVKSRYNWEGLEFPLPLKDIPVFEKKNNVSINVFGLDVTFKKTEDNKTCPVYSLFPLKVCDNELPYHTDLLYLSNENTNHYAYIKDFNRLVRSQKTKRGNSIHICKRCFTHFDDQPNKLNLSGAERLIEHKKYCGSNNPLRLDLSDEKFIKFKNSERSQRSRFTLYADFECSLHPYDFVQPDPNPKKPKSYSLPTQLHVPYSYCYHIVDSQNVFSETRLYRGDNVAHHFMESIKNDMLHIGDILYNDRQMYPTLSTDEQKEFESSTECYLCGKQFTDSDPKVRDHSHTTPYNYRGAAHKSCNLKFTEQNTVNCYFHNLSSYDAHFIIPELNIDNGRIQVVANTEEKYLCFSKQINYDGAKRNYLKLQFVDSFRFMNSSLSTLVNNLPKDLLKVTKKQFPQQNQFDLISRKGVFPYDYVSSEEILDESSLPPQEAFFNSLTLENVKEEDYLHAQTVRTTFGINTLGEYSDLYLKSDVLLLVYVFEGFRDMCLREYKLDPAHYLTLPSYAWDVMLKTTDVTLDTIQDADQYLFFEKGIRGGICQCCTRHAQANNKYCSKYDSTKPSQYVIYLDANNLYGWGMIQPLASGNFQWLSPGEVLAIEQRLPNLCADSSTGYLFEVDLSYPEHLHNKHRSLPFCCENKKPPNGKFSKLLTTLSDKKNYIIHYRTLQQALENGLKIDKIHRVLSFNQSTWLKPYIEKNTALRKCAKNEFEKDLFKLMNNAVFGVSMTNARKFIDIRLVCDGKQFEKLVARSTFIDRTFYGNDLALVHLEKTKIVLDKPIYVGACILELSKWLMYDFHYNKMLPRYPNRIDLLYTDTDSLIYNIQCDDIFVELLDHLDDFDTSEYCPENPCFRTTNAKVLGKFKDETKGKVIKEFIGLLPKLYCVVKENDDGTEEVIKRAKGVTKGVVKHQLTVEDYRTCLMTNIDKFTINTRFVSKKHEVNTVFVNEKSLSTGDDKRYILPDNIHTLPWGHCGIPTKS